MARFDVYEIRSTGGWAVDVQADFLAHLKTRVIVPLLQGEEADWPMPRLSPKILFNSKIWSLGTPFMTGVPLRELNGPVGSVVDHEDQIGIALDLLLTGV